MSISNSYPQQRPVFSFNADAGKLDSRISYSRSSTGTYLSNEKALNSENLLLDSKTGTGNWTRDRSGAALVPVITANHSASPDGTANQATRVQLDLNGSTTPSDYARYYQAHNVASGTSATFAVWMRSTDGASSYAAQILSPAGPGVAVTITGSWQKFTVTADSSGNITYGVRLRGGQTPTNADTADILIWGANLSTIGQTVLSETTSQIHREYSPLLKTAAADEPRFEYAADGQSVGLAIEAQSSNLLTYSEDFSNAAWTSFRASKSASVAVGPDGNLSAGMLTEDETASASHGMFAEYNSTSGNAYTYSVFAKAAGRNYLQILFSNYGGRFGSESFTFNLSNGTLGATNSGLTSYSIQACGNGWYRCSATVTATGTGTARVAFYTAQSDSASTDLYTGNGYSGLILFGASVEQASSVSSYIKSNSGSSTTRASDSCSVATSSFGYTGGSVTVVGEITGTGSGYSALFELRDTVSKAAGINDYMMVWKTSSTDTDASNFSLYVYDKSTLQAAPTIAGSGGATTVATRVDTNNVGACADGGAVAADTSAVIPDSLDTLYIGRGYSGYELGSTIKRLAVYSAALSDTELQALTS